MRRFLAAISVYPVQSYVSLSNGADGRVLTVRDNNPFRPVVEIIRDELGRTPATRYVIDLDSPDHEELYIEEVLDAPE